MAQSREQIVKNAIADVERQVKHLNEAALDPFAISGGEMEYNDNIARLLEQRESLQRQLVK
jgi:hypothetical protein